MKANQPRPDKEPEKAHILLLLYWLYKVLNGANIPKTTLGVLLMERESAGRLRQRQKNESGKTSKRSSTPPKASARLIFGGLKGKILRSTLKKAVKKQKII